MCMKIKRSKLFLFALGFFGLLLACEYLIPPLTPTIPTAPTTPTQITKVDLDKVADDYPSVDSSTSAYPLQMLIACKIMDVSCSWQTQIFDNTLFILPDLIDEEGLELLNTIPRSGTHGSYINLIEGAADFILVAREPSDDELEAAEDNDVELDVQPVALDAFVFLVNVENLIDTLTIDQIREIYRGDITEWSEFTSPGGPIQAYQRNPNSGSQELMEKLVMKGAPMIDAPFMMMQTMIGAINAVSGDPLGIGYSVYYYATFMLPDENVKLIGINGVMPSADNIADRSYPLTTEVYVVVRKDMSSGSTALMLRNWLLTTEGQNIVEESGYVPLD